MRKISGLDAPGLIALSGTSTTTSPKRGRGWVEAVVRKRTAYSDRLNATLPFNHSVVLLSKFLNGVLFLFYILIYFRTRVLSRLLLLNARMKAHELLGEVDLLPCFEVMSRQNPSGLLGVGDDHRRGYGVAGFLDAIDVELG